MDTWKLAELLGQLLAYIIVVVLFLKYMSKNSEGEQKQVQHYIDELTEVGKECHLMSRQSQKLYQDQMDLVIQRSHDDTMRITEALTSLTAEVRTLNRMNGVSRGAK